LYAANFIDTGDIDSGIKLLKEIEDSELSNEEDYLMTYSLGIQAALESDAGMKHRLMEKKESLEDDFTISITTKEKAPLIFPDFM